MDDSPNPISSTTVSREPFLFEYFRVWILNNNPKTIIIEFTEGKYRDFVVTTRDITARPVSESVFEIDQAYHVVNHPRLYEVNAFNEAVKDCIKMYVLQVINGSPDAEKRDVNSQRPDSKC